MDDETRQELWIPPQSSIPAEYQLLETLGYGAEGIVYHAWHKQMHRHSCDPSYVSPEQCEQGVLDARAKANGRSKAVASLIPQLLIRV